MSAVSATLRERDARYGTFRELSYTSQALKAVFRQTTNWKATLLNASQREALEMIASKIARILNGDPEYIDSWHDIAGYATLIEQELQEQERAREAWEGMDREPL